MREADSEAGVVQVLQLGQDPDGILDRARLEPDPLEMAAHLAFGAITETEVSVGTIQRVLQAIGWCTRRVRRHR